MEPLSYKWWKLAQKCHANDNLKPCPFCGHESARRMSAPLPSLKVVCDVTEGGCGGSSGYAPTIEGAVDKWNRRDE